MLELLNSHAHGYLAMPIIATCRKRGFFDLFQNGQRDLSLEELTHILNANRGHMQVVLRLFCSLDWMKQVEGKYKLVSSNYQKIPENIGVLFRFSFDRYLLTSNRWQKKNSLNILSAKRKFTFEKWLDHSICEWGIDDKNLSHMLDGVLLVPLLLSLKRNQLIIRQTEGFFVFSHQIDVNTKKTLFNFFLNKGWLIGQLNKWSWSDIGGFVWDRAFNHAALASYFPMLSRVDTLLFGRAKTVFKRNRKGQESHVDRQLNVIGSGFQHAHFFSDLTATLSNLFDRLPCSDQPKYIIDMGCGDGTLLYQVYNHIKNNTIRGKELDCYPLTMVGADYNAEALIVTKNTLRDIPHLVLTADINDPEKLAADLNAYGIRNKDEILHIRSFLDHERPYSDSVSHQNLSITISSLPYSGVYTDNVGRLISARHVMLSLIEHFIRWKKIIGRYGILILEVHCLPSEIVSAYLNQAESLHFDAYHAFSGQSLIEPMYFLIAAAQAGLVPIDTFSHRYPRFLPFTRITLNWFKPEEYSIRFATLDDIETIAKIDDRSDMLTDSVLIRKSLSDFPQGQYVLLMESVIVAAVCTRKEGDGSTVRLLGLKRDWQYRGFDVARTLLTFVFQHIAVQAGIKTIVGRIPCHVLSQEEYQHFIDNDGIPLDPSVRFFCQYGKIKNNINTIDNRSQYDIEFAYSFEGLESVNETTALVDDNKADFKKQKSYVLDSVEACIFQLIPQKEKRNYSIVMSLRDLGFDSLHLLELQTLLEKKFKKTLDLGFFFKYTTVEKIVDYFEKIVMVAPSIEVVLPSKKLVNKYTDIAVIGFSGRFPDADTVEGFWDNLVNGVQSFKEVPKERWDVNEFFSLDPDLPNTTCSRVGSFLDNYDRFDPLFFNISPKEAELMDPQQRLFLQEAWRTFEDAGYSDKKLKNSRCGVFVGATYGEYSELLSKAAWQNESAAFMGLSPSILASRISYFLNLKGPSIAVDTACSSSLVAVHLACQSLINKECDLALAGGVSSLLTPQMHIRTSKSGMLSPSGMCSAFDEKADGIVLGEGVGAVLLKPLQQAIDDNDTIYAVIKGSAINQDGSSNGITAPNPESQTALALEVYKSADIHPDSIGYVEMHGTGTPLGDPIEFNALKEAFDQYTKKRNYCAIGSVKNNIGHTTFAAGILGFIKTLLSISYKKIVPHLHFSQLNSHLDLNNSPFFINTQLKDWKPIAGYPRRAAISSFGFSGTNAHLVIEEAPTQALNSAKNKPYYLLTLSAKNEVVLRERLIELSKWLKQNAGKSLSAIAYTLNAGRSHFYWRCAMVVSSLDDLQQQLNQIERRLKPKGYFIAGLQEPSKNDPVVIKEITTILESLCHDFINDTVLYYNNLLILAKYYVEGYDINWDTLHQLEACQKIRLPTYPFLQDRYWVPEKNNEDIEKNQAKMYKKTLWGDEFFLTEHVIKDQKILPGMAYFEIVQEAFQKFFPNYVDVQFSEILWFQPLIVSDKHEICVGLYPLIQGFRYEVTGPHGLYSQGEIHKTAKKTVSSASVVLEKLSSELNDTIMHDDFYKIFENVGILYGQRFKLLQWVKTNGITALGYYHEKLDRLDEKKSNFIPNILDAALQTIWSILYYKKNKKELFLPFSMADIQLYSLLPMIGYVYAWITTDAKTHIKSYHFQILDENGKICAAAEKLQARVEKIEETLLYYTPVWKEKSYNTLSIKSKNLVIFCNENYLIEKIRQKKENCCVIQIKSGDSYKILSKDCYQVRLGNEADYQQLLVDWADYSFSIDQVIFARDLQWSADYTIQQFSEMSFKELFIFIQLQLKKNHQKISSFVHFYLYDDQSLSLTVACQGFFKSLKQEYPQGDFRSVGLETGNSFENYIELVQKECECLPDLTQTHVRYSGHDRFIEQYELVNPEKNSITPWRFSGVYLITGGLGGLGFKLASYLAENYAACLVLIGRSNLDSNKKEQLQTLKHLGAKHVDYFSVDVTKVEQVHECIATLKASLGGLHGVIHCAGLVQDSLFINKRWETFSDIFSVKAMGAIHLDSATQDQQLDCFILFSSLVSCFGNVGQTDYAAANAFLDYFALWRSIEKKHARRQGHTIAINWPYWQDSGMSIDANTMNYLESILKTKPLSSSLAIEALNQACSGIYSQLGVTWAVASDFSQVLSHSVIHQTKKPAMTVQECDKDVLFLMQDRLQVLMAETIKLPKNQLQLNTSFDSYGFDSIIIVQITRQLEKDFGWLPKTLLFEYRTISELANYFVKNHSDKLKRLLNLNDRAPEVLELQASSELMKPAQFVQSNEEVEADDIAIIGLSGCYPMADDLDVFWDNLKNKRDCVTEIPKKRWDYSSFYEKNRDAVGKTYGKWGGFIDDFDQFDPHFFNISPREAVLMDPQERLFLQLAWQALEDAGYAANELRDSEVMGVFVGVMYGLYQLHGVDTNCPMPNSLYASIANRVSYFLNLNGPSLAVDTMCSSSLTAIHLACESIRRGECQMALAGGINIISHFSKYIFLSQGKFLSTDGRCKSFGDGGDGYVPGEGGGVVVLKPLTKALRDRDLIYGIIKGSSINHDGRTNGYMVPNPNAQADLFQKTFAKTKIQPSDLSYVEAHGTGTRLGDPIEIRGLAKAWATSASNQCCPIGSVKSNIGHLESAAGIAALTKVLLQFKNKQLVPSIHSTVLNADIDFSDTPFTVQQTLEDWVEPEGKLRYASVSSFGAGGSNGHLIIQEAPEPLELEQKNRPYYLVFLSAKHPTALENRVNDLIEWLEENLDTSLSALSYTLNVTRQHFQYRTAVLASSIENLMCQLKKISDFQSLSRRQPDHKLNSDEIMANWLAQSNAMIDNDEAWYEKHLSEMMAFYLEGFDLNWRLLYSDTASQKIRLPTYPFMKKSYWIEKKQEKEKIPMNEIIEKETTVMIEKNNLMESIEIQLKDILKKLLCLEEDYLYDKNESVISYGMDSILGIEFIKQINTLFSTNLNVSKFYDHPTLATLSTYLANEVSQSTSGEQSYTLDRNDMLNLSEAAVDVVAKPIKLKSIGSLTVSSDESSVSRELVAQTDEIAIIGMAGYFPDARNLEEYWENLKSGICSVVEIPNDRWSIKKYYSNTGEPGKSCSKWGAFIKEVDQFDPLFFNLSPLDAEWMDPQQRLFLEVSWKALEDAGYSQTKLDNARCGVYVGVMNNDYKELIQRTGRQSMGSAMLGNSDSILASRIAYHLNLKGPVITVDTACSSSLVAVHLATQALLQQEADIMIAGGVTLYLSETPYLQMSQTGGMLSPDGVCRPFDHKANGFVPGEGCGAVVLKRLNDAIQDGDTIYGVIKGSGINQDGKSNGITAPNPASQKALELSVYARADINPEHITYVETHGTGTRLGDPVEIQALSETFQTYTNNKKFCAIGSVKGNIGHTSAAAGVASLIKVLLCLQHKQLVPTLHYDEANEHIRFSDSPFYVNTALQSWTTEKNTLRMAAINSFGFSGTNVHLVLEEFPAVMSSFSEQDRTSHLLTISAKDSEVLQQQLVNLSYALKQKNGDALSDIAYTLNIGRTHFHYRIAFVAASVEELMLQIEDAINQKSSPHYFKGQVLTQLEDHAIYKKVLQHTLLEIDQALAKEPESYRQNLEVLANLYVKGYEIDFTLLYNHRVHKKCRLPTYPFLKQRHWLPLPNFTADASLTANNKRAHPLIQHNLSTIHCLSFSYTVRGDEFFLNDHCLQGQTVFPGVVCLELALAAGDMANPEGKVVVLRNIQWLQKWVVTTQTEMLIRLYKKKDYIDYDIFYQTDHDSVCITRGELLYEIDNCDQITDHYLSVQEIMHGLTQEIVADSLYKQLVSNGFVYGPSFQVLQWIKSNDHSALSYFDISQQSTVAEPYRLYPGLLDGAIQTAWPLVDKAFVIPCAMDALTVYRSLPLTGYVYIRLLDQQQHSSGYVCDVQLLDVSGNVCLRLTGLQLRRIQKTSVLPVNDTPRLRYYTPVWRESAFSELVVKEKTSIKGLLVISDNNDFVLGLRHQLTHFDLIQVSHGDSYAMVNANHYQINMLQKSDYVSMLQAIAAEDFFVSHVIFSLDFQPLYPLGYLNTVHALILFLQTLMALKTGHSSIKVISPYFYQENELNPTWPFGAMLAGLAKTISQEQNQLRLVALGLDFSQPMPLATNQVQQELLIEQQECHVRYFMQARQWEDYQFFTPTHANRVVENWRLSGVYLIVGGLGKIGFKIAEYLAKNYRARLLLTGRHELGQDQKNKIKFLEQIGAQIFYLSGNVSDENTVIDWVSKVKNRFGVLHGIIHSAGITEDSLFINKKWDKYCAVISSKIEGTINLDKATKNEKLDFFILFSSIASYLGNVGQSDYALANAFLDYFSHWRLNAVQQGIRQGQTLTINWPYLQDGGMSIHPEEEKYWNKFFGIKALSFDSMMIALNQALQEKSAQIGVIYSTKDITQLDRQPPSSSVIKEAGQAQQYIRKKIASLLKLPVEKLKPDSSFENYGIDSILAIEMTRALEEDFGILPKTLFFEYNTLNQLVTYFTENYADFFQKISSFTPNIIKESLDLKSTANSTRKENNDIAIIGLSGRYPMAETLDQFWDQLKNAKDSIAEISHERWDWRMYHSDGVMPGKSYSRWGGFLSDIDQFDPLFFNISPREAGIMDPQERVFLETAFSAFEDAGYTETALEKNRVGVFVGVMHNDYSLCQEDACFKHELGYAQSSHWSIANRVSYHFNLNGPSLVVDTACSASLTAIHLACESIKRQESDVALAGGVNLILHPNHYIGLSQLQMLSSNDQCRAFGENADGFVAGEGVGAVVLKPLAQALIDGNRVYGIIKGTAINSGGKTTGFTVPNPNRQAELIQCAIASANIDPSTIGYIEAHGTGTALGDPIEIRGLEKAFSGTNLQRCPIGSVKSNIGHSESAAGIASVTKVLLQFKHQHLVPSLHSECLNPNINFENTPFYLQQRYEKWDPDLDYPCRAGISAFGAGGSNAHIILEEPPKLQTFLGKKKPYYLILLSAKHERSLQQKAKDLFEYLTKDLDLLLSELAYTLNVTRNHFEHRVSIIASSLPDLQKKLALIQQMKEGDDIYYGEKQRQQGASLNDYVLKNTLDTLGSDLAENPVAYKQSLILLARFYAQGFSFDFNGLHANEEKRLIHLPSYPFLKNRYWFNDNKRPSVKISSTHLETDNVKIVLQPTSLKPITHNSNQPILKNEQYFSEKITEKKSVEELDEIKCFLSDELKALCYLTEDVAYDKPFSFYGVDSLLGMEFIKKVNLKYGLNFSAAKLYDYSTIHSLAETIRDAAVTSNIEQICSKNKVAPVLEPEVKSNITNALSGTSTHEDRIAIIGMAAYLPGSNDLEAFWKNLANGHSSVTEIPIERWSIEQHFSTDISEDKSYSKWGGFLSDIDLFDTNFFEIAPIEAEQMDPQQRLFLEVCWHALEDSGCVQTLGGSRCGVYASVMHNDYLEILHRNRQTTASPELKMLGNSNAILASRIAYFLNLKGPTITVDTACSSSLVATHLACQALNKNEADIMLAGGVTLYLTETPYISMSNAGMLSKEGLCKTFDDSADGFVPGEGCAVLVLKRLNDALKAGDPIHGIIRGSGINQDGRTNGITAPSSVSQKELEITVYQKSDTHPENISYVEAHGTGTHLGDPIEVQALTEAFSTFTDKKQYCAIGSLKSNIGHTSAAAGVASVIKTLLCMKNKQLVPSLHFNFPNKHIDFSQTPFYVNKKLKPWETKDNQARLAAVSSFGYSGTNAHLVLEEARMPQVLRQSKSHYLVTLSAKQVDSLMRSILNLHEWLLRKNNTSLEALAYTLNTGRLHFHYRCAFVVSSVEELAEKLKQVFHGQTPMDYFYGYIKDEINDLGIYDTAVDATLEKYSRKYLQIIANCYVKGYKIDWQSLHVGELHQRIHLPTYPFLKKRYWHDSYQSDKKSVITEEISDNQIESTQTHY